MSLVMRPNLFLFVVYLCHKEREVFNMSNKLTELVFIIDRSGSMAGLESDTIGGFNSMIEKQKKFPGKCFVSTILFDHESLVLHDRVTLDAIKPMNEDDYSVRGCTALVDAIGNAICHIGNIHKYARKEDVPNHTVFVITTDGMENASRKYTSKQVKEMVERQKSKYGWEFIFLGANIDAVETAHQFGISDDRAVNYHCDSQGVKLNYQAVSDVLYSMRSDKKVSCEWKKEIEKDYRSRKKQ